MCCKFFTNTPAGAYWLFSELLTGLAAEKRASLAIFKSVLLALSVGTGNVCGDIFAVRYEIHDKNTPTFWQQMTYNVIQPDSKNMIKRNEILEKFGIVICEQEDFRMNKTEVAKDTYREE